MNIAVLHRYPPSQAVGTNASFIEFLKKLVKMGHKVYYVTFKDRFGLPAIKGVKYITLPFYFDRGNNRDKKIKTWIWILLVPLYIWKMQKKYRLKLVYCDDSVPLYGFLSKIISPKSKVVIRLGDLQTGYSLSESHPILFNISQVVEGLMWKKVDGLIAISKAFKNYLISKNIPEKKIKIVEESINLDVKIHTQTRKSSKTVFLFHGAILKCKGLETLIDAFQVVSKRYKKVGLIIAGGGDQESTIIEKAKKIKNIELTGWYDHQKLDEIMNKSDIGIAMRSGNMANHFVVTTCLLENWKYKKPVIAPNLTSIANIVIHGTNGLLFTPNSSSDLAEKMIFLIKNKNIRTKLAEEGHKTAEKIFDHKKIAIKMVNALMSI